MGTGVERKMNKNIEKRKDRERAAHKCMESLRLSSREISRRGGRLSRLSER